MTRVATAVVTAPRRTRPARTASAMPKILMEGELGRLEIAAVDLRGAAVDDLLQLAEMRMEREGLAIGLQHARAVVRRYVHVPEPGPGPEMARLALDHLPDVGHGARRILQE